MKKLRYHILLILFMVFLITMELNAQLNGSFNIGASEPAPFNSITNAVNHLNSVGVSGPVEFVLVDTLYTSSSTENGNESFPITFGSISGTSQNDIVEIKPAQGLDVLIESGNDPSETSTFLIDQAEWLEVLAENPNSNLTIINRNDMGDAVVDIKSGSSNLGFNGINIWSAAAAGFSINNAIDIRFIKCNLGGLPGGSAQPLDDIFAEQTSNVTIDNCSFGVDRDLAAFYGFGLDNHSFTSNIISMDPSTGIHNTGVELDNSAWIFISDNSFTDGSIVPLRETKWSPVHDTLNSKKLARKHKGSARNRYGENTSLATGTGILVRNTSDTLEIFNNFISLGWNASEGGAGISLQPMGGDAIYKIYNNTVVIGGSNESLGGSNAAFLNSGTGAYSYDIRDNIFINLRTNTPASQAFHYALALEDPMGKANLDYNDYFVADDVNNFLFYFNGANIDTLPQWITATGEDSNSVSTDVEFEDAPGGDLHLSGMSIGDSLLYGIPLPEITEDIDGDPRDPNNPYMGADEYTVIGVKNFKAGVPDKFILEQNYPNPFNPTTNIEFFIPNTEFVTLSVYNILGEEVATLVSERLTAGEYQYKWDANGLASGVYLYRLQAGDYIEVKKMVLMR